MYEKHLLYAIAENQKYTQRKKIIEKYIMKKLLFIVKKINWMKTDFTFTDENFHKYKAYRDKKKIIKRWWGGDNFPGAIFLGQFSSG